MVRPGGLPIEEGIAVFNVETIYNVYRALEQNTPVVDKVVSIVAEVEHPVTVRVPIGCTIEEVVALAGKTTVKDPVYLVGGPMMGNIGTGSQPVTKTTNAILVLPPDHYLVKKKNSNPSIEMNRAASICCQCQMCTDLCPRHAVYRSLSKTCTGTSDSATSLYESGIEQGFPRCESLYQYHVLFFLRIM